MQRESVAKILILNDQDEVLVLRIGEYEGYPEKSHKPDLPGGLVDPGESEHQGVVREVLEETGIILEPQDVTLVYAETAAYTNENKSVSKLLYVARLNHTPKVVVSWEHESYEWCPLANVIETHEFRPFYKRAIEYSRNNQLT
ncbi:MAG TPA: NUDIX domain-containing protein [Candidatus Saccharimonadales bacterium]|jgi:8-oxo-dGTP pyrophosphatase MutT (NUDIX family)|nr:NUDIX domain-containing protein [Candidatus Saccharimonadales bacterium]